MQSVKAAIQPLKFPSGHVLSRDAMFFSIIKICIVIEEINILNGMCKDDIYLRKLMNCVKPFTSTATKYEKDFNNFRNSFVAHLQRDKKKKFKVYSSIFDTLNVPRHQREWDFIYDCLELFKQVLVGAYPAFLKFNDEMSRQIYKDVHEFANRFIPKEAIDLEQVKKLVNVRLTEQKFIEQGVNYFTYS